MCKTIATIAFGVMLLGRSPLIAEDVEMAWVRAQYPLVLKALMGDVSVLNQIDAGRTAWVVTVQVSPGFEASEYQVIVIKEFGGTIKIKQTALDGSLDHQLLNLKKKGVTTSEQLIAGVSVIQKEKSFSLSQSAAAKKLVKDFEALRLPAVRENVTLMDPSTYDVWIDSGVQMIHLHFMGSSQGADNIPLIRWIQNARRLAA